MAYKKVYKKEELSKKTVDGLKKILDSRKLEYKKGLKKPALVNLVIATNLESGLVEKGSYEYNKATDKLDKVKDILPKEVKKTSEDVICAVCDHPMKLINDAWNKKVYQCTNENCKRILKVM